MWYLDTVLIDGRVGTLRRGKIDLDVWGENVEGVCGFREVPAL